MELVPIKEEPEQNEEFISNPLCKESIYVAINFFKKIGYVLPWIGYYVRKNELLVGSAAFKGPPVNGFVEIAYGTFEEYQNQGIGTAICKQLVDLSLKTDPSVKITARTLARAGFSTSILKKNKFIYIGTVNDPEDGQVWEWLFQPNQ